MRPIKYLPAQLSPEELEAEQKIIIIKTGRDKRKGFYEIQATYEAFMERGELFTIDDIASALKGHSSNHVRLCLTETQKEAMRALRSNYQAIQRAYEEMREAGGTVGYAEVARRAGVSSSTAKYNLTPEQQEWVEKNWTWHK
jgi:hypothetical protein